MNLPKFIRHFIGFSIDVVLPSAAIQQRPHLSESKKSLNNAVTQIQ
jgi:hypothetical protein